MPTEEQIVSRKVVFPHLDGLRFLCFFAVFLFHAFYTDSAGIARSGAYRAVRSLFHHGDLGVNFFFVLSGFLITYLLLEEKRRWGRIHVGYFYLRRMLRIWPLYFACLAFGFLAFPVLKRLSGLEPNETADPIMYLFFLGNFDVIRHGLPDAGVLGVLWSVAVEEQFYLAWPLLLAAVRTGRELWILIAVLLGSILFRSAQTDSDVLTFHTMGLVGDMAVGGLAAYAVIQFPPFQNWIASLRVAAISVLYGAAAVLCFSNAGSFFYPFDRLVPALVFAFIILEQNYAASSLFKMGSSPLLTHLGQQTYGMYCLHMVGNVAALQLARFLGIGDRIWHVLLLVPAVSLGITLLMSGFSYRFFEKPFLHLKTRFQFIARG